MHRKIKTDMQHKNRDGNGEQQYNRNRKEWHAQKNKNRMTIREADEHKKKLLQKLM